MLNIKVRTTESKKELLLDLARKKGFVSKARNVELSKYLRWVLKHGEKPVHREKYSNIKTSIQNVVRLGNLLN